MPRELSHGYLDSITFPMLDNICPLYVGHSYYMGFGIKKHFHCPNTLGSASPSKNQYKQKKITGNYFTFSFLNTPLKFILCQWIKQKKEKRLKEIVMLYQKQPVFSSDGSATWKQDKFMNSSIFGIWLLDWENSCNRFYTPPPTLPHPHLTPVRESF